jgi:hypothetical protein
LVSETEVFDFKVDTAAPQIQLPSRWYIWESGEFVIKDHGSKIVALGYEISDPQNRWKKVERSWTPNTEEFSYTIAWNRVFADGIVALIGSYTVTVFAVDEAGNRSQKSAQILIPQPNATPLPTFTPVPTATIAPNTPVPTEMAVIPAVEPTATSQSNSGGFSFGTKDDSVETQSTNPDSQLPNSQSPILWGATAAAVVGAAMADTLDKQRKRKEAEAASRAAAQKKADRLNEAERQRKIRNYLQGQAILKAQEEAARKEAQEERALKFKEKFLNPAKVVEPSLAEVQARMAIKAQKDAELDAATRSYMAMGAAVTAQKEKEQHLAGLQAYYDGRKDGESALSQLIYKFTYNPNSESETALERMKNVLEETGSGP